MKSREGDAPSAQTPTTVYPSIAADEGVDHQEVSHVIHCMQCDLQFQIDMAVTSRKGSQEIDEGVVRVWLDPRIKLEREAYIWGASQIGRTEATLFLSGGEKEKREMITLTQPLRDEHKELLPHIELLRTVADAIGEASFASLRRGVDEAYAFLTRHLLPHAQAEERALYPVVGRLMGAPEATATMSRDHVEVARLAEELGSLRSHLVGASLSESQEQALRRVLYGLSAIVRVHFAKEEEVYLPILDARLTAEEATRMFEAMELAAQEAKSAVG